MNFDRLHHWERFAPNLGDNRKLSEREQLALELATGLSILELEAFGNAQTAAVAAARAAIPDLKRPGKGASAEANAAYVTAAKGALEAFKAAQVDVLAPLWSPFVRIAPGQHSINGKPLTTLADYLGAVLMQPGLFNFLELQREVMTLNSVDGTHALFLRALSGGSDSTGDLNSADEKGER